MLEYLSSWLITLSSDMNIPTKIGGGIDSQKMSPRTRCCRENSPGSKLRAETLVWDLLRASSLKNGVHQRGVS